MPRYEYSCSACGKSFEVNQRMSDPPLTECACGGKGTVKRLMSAGSGLIFKGSGFYITDYKNGGGGSASSPAAAGAAKPAESKAGESAAPAAAPAAAPTSGASSTGSGGSGGGCGSGCGCNS